MYKPQVGYLFSSFEYVVCTWYSGMHERESTAQHSSSTAKTIKIKPKNSERNERVYLVARIGRNVYPGTKYDPGGMSLTHTTEHRASPVCVLHNSFR